MSFDLPTLESQGEGETISQQEAEAKILKISDIQTHIQKITQNQDPEIRERLKNSGLQDEVLQFISDAANNNLDEHSHEYSKERFDTDGEDGLDSFEFKNFSDSLSSAIEQIIILDGIGAFNEIQEDSDYSGWYSPDKKLSEYADFQELFLGDDEGSSFSEEALNSLGINDGELHEMAEKPFDITSSDSWGEMGILLVKELGDGVEDILRFMGNIPAGAILLPRYLSYRIDVNSSDPIEAVEGEIKIKELVADNPSLGILDLLGEKGVDMIKHLGAMLISGKQGDIAMTLVTIAGLLAGGAGAIKLGARATNMSRIERVAGNIQRGAQRVDDIVGGAGIGHMTGSFKEPQAADVNISLGMIDTPEARNTPQVNTTLETPIGSVGLPGNFSLGDTVIIPRFNGSTSQAQIVGFNGDKAIVEWTENGQTLSKTVDVSQLQRILNVLPEMLQDIHSLDSGFIIELKNGARGYVTARSGNTISLEISLPEGGIQYKNISIDGLIQHAENIDDIVRHRPHEVQIPDKNSLEEVIQYISSMNIPGIKGNGGAFFTKGEILNLLEEIKGGNYGIIDNLTRSGGLRDIVKNAIKTTPPKIPHQIGQEVYIKRSNGTIERGWIIEEIINGEIHVRNSQRGDMTRRSDTDEVYSIQQIEGGQIELFNTAAEFQRKKLELLDSRLNLSKEDFHNLFDGDFGQRNVGNCYFVAAMHSLKESPDFEMIMRTSMKKVNGGYQVQIPMLSTWTGKSIFVPDNVLGPQRNPRFRIANSQGKVDNRVFLDPIDGPLGYQLLEMAYIIEKFGSLDRLRAEGGFGSEVLSRMTGDNFIETKVGDFSRVSLNEQGSKSAFLKFAQEYDPRRNIATVNSMVGNNGHNTSYFIDGIKIANGHAYSIMNIDRFSQTVTLRNPWVGQKPIMMNYDQFLRAFSNIDGVQINYDALLNNI